VVRRRRHPARWAGREPRRQWVAARNVGKRGVGQRGFKLHDGLGGRTRLLRGYARPRWGNLRRTTPFSSTFGFERGTPIDRHYLHRFLDAHRDAITGNVLEVQTDSYTKRFGHHVRRADTFDIVPSADVTYVCDFSRCEGSIPDRAYDCLLLPNTLPHFRELEPALSNAIRVVRPGGAILASAAGLLPLTGDVPDYWRLSPDGWRERLSAAWPGATLEIVGHGNCLAAIAAQLGLALEELTQAELDAYDVRYPVLTTIVCRTPQ
jgi:SAM-dependent methyltransferase